MRINIQQVSQPQGCCLLPRWYTIWHLRGFSSNEITLPETTYLGLKCQEGRNTLRYPPSPCQIPDGTAPWGSGSFFYPHTYLPLTAVFAHFYQCKIPAEDPSIRWENYIFNPSAPLTWLVTFVSHFVSNINIDICITLLVTHVHNMHSC